MGRQAGRDLLGAGGSSLDPWILDIGYWNSFVTPEYPTSNFQVEEVAVQVPLLKPKVGRGGLAAP
jgi:hypothetical protein